MRDTASVAWHRTEDARVIPEDLRLSTGLSFESEANTKAKNAEGYKVVLIDVCKRVPAVFRLSGNPF